MTDASPDYRDTVFLPKTAFPMKAGLAQKEPAILAKWQADDLYGKLRAARAGAKRFILHDGPPYANGDIHMGHAMNKVLKDIVVRTRTLMGYDAPYVPGWDCHGLPIEWKVEEAYRAKKLNKDEVPVADFRAECRAYAEKWVAVQRAQFERLGVMGDWADPYLTMKYEAEAGIVAEFLKFAESGQLYRGAKPVMWSPVEKTALAEAEVEYEDIVSTQIDVAFEIVETKSPAVQALLDKGYLKTFAVIWTTTPWTIPVNQAIAYGPDINYVLMPEGGTVNTYLVAEPLAAEFWKRVEERHPGICAYHESEWVIVKGADLAGTMVLHPMAGRLSPLPFRGGVGGGAGRPEDAANGVPHPNPSPEGEGLSSAAFFARPRPFLPGDFVTTDAGTGLVHMAPDHGEDDFELCRAHGIDPVFAVEGDGKYRADWAWLGGQGSVINAKFNAPDGPICTDLRAAGALLAASADYKHSYPHSWRSKAKVIFRATPQWFIPMDRSISRDLPGAGHGAEVGEQSEPWPLPPSTSGEGPGVGDAASGSPALADLPHPDPSPEGEGLPTLRATALAAIADTRFVPEKGRNRIAAMVADRPDWVISRQRAWGVPIAVYLDRETGTYLNDPQVNARIVEAFRAGGADAWFTADHQALLGNEHDLARYQPVTDILDVWFDSGSTHAFVIEARYGAGVRADLYLEGSDQHRGWFQSSLLESCGTRGRAPYEAVLTHGFALDGQGRKMSKSVGNVVDPLKIIRESGADILRLWVATTDYVEDVRIGKEVLATTSDTYRKLRNTFRYLLGALDGFVEAEALPTGEMPELERYLLAKLVRLDAELRDVADAYEFTRYAAALTGFANNDLSAFFFDVRKDSLYCDAPASPTRRAYRTVLDILFHALVRWAAPILCFTAEEVWGTRFADAGSVHMLEWPTVDPAWADEALEVKWARLREVRGLVTAAIEPLRREKMIGSSLEADVTLIAYRPADAALLRRADMAEIAIAARVELCAGDPATPLGDDPGEAVTVEVRKTDYEKCGRCWRHLPEVAVADALCDRCAAVVGPRA